MNNVSWKECQFVIIDVEGNGQTPQEIIELSIVPVFCEQISKHILGLSALKCE